MQSALHRLARAAAAAAFFLFVLAGPVFPQSARREVHFPDIPGFMVLACDLHMHTVFSDGNIWPTLRVEEAWIDGLDAFSLTDHLEYVPHKDDIPVHHGRSFELAAPLARALDLISIRGAEISRKMPPGHFNALFLESVGPLDTKEWRDALKAAVDQGAFIFFNHPPFPQPEGKSVWYPEHEELHGKGWLHGIEVVNGDSYYPEAHRWCLEKGLAMIASSDAHNPMAMDYGPGTGQAHRPLTLVLARERTAASLKEALFARRTAVWWQEKLIGREEHLRPIFEASIEVATPELKLRSRESTFLQVRNRSDVPFELALTIPADLTASDRLVLPAGMMGRLALRLKKGAQAGRREVSIPCRVTNLLISPAEGLPAALRFMATFQVGQEM